jgi:hypothetical protein
MVLGPRRLTEPLPYTHLCAIVGGLFGLCVGAAITALLVIYLGSLVPLGGALKVAMIVWFVATYTVTGALSGAKAGKAGVWRGLLSVIGGALSGVLIGLVLALAPGLWPGDLSVLFVGGLLAGTALGA